MEKALCQDCLKVKEFENYEDTHIIKCDCGGDFCECGGCLKTINDLSAGIRDYKILGLQNPIKNWNEKDGILC